MAMSQSSPDTTVTAATPSVPRRAPALRRDVIGTPCVPDAPTPTRAAKPSLGQTHLLAACATLSGRHRSAVRGVARGSPFCDRVPKAAQKERGRSARETREAVSSLFRQRNREFLHVVSPVLKIAAVFARVMYFCGVLNCPYLRRALCHRSSTKITSLYREDRRQGI